MKLQRIGVSKGKFPGLFGGVGFHNNDAMFYTLMEDDFFWQKVCKSYREINPGFMRTFAGFGNWTRQAMDAFSDYYEKMQKVTDTPMYLAPPNVPQHFSDAEIEEYADGVAQRLHYLYYDRDVKHIRYYCLSNELTGATFGCFLNDLDTFKKYHEALYRAFRRYELPIGLLATDSPQYETWNTIDWAIENMDGITEDYCAHIYERPHDIRDLSFYDYFYHQCLTMVMKCVKRGKRFILGEVGIQKLLDETQKREEWIPMEQLTMHPGVVEDTCRYFQIPGDDAYCALMLTEMSFAAINAGVYATVYWTSIDCPDPYNARYSSKEGFAKAWSEAEPFMTYTMKNKYNKWGCFKWDSDGNHDVRPHYWALAPLMKFFGRNTQVMDVRCDDPLLRVCSVSSWDGRSCTVGVVNRHTESTGIVLDTALFKKDIRVYEYDPKHVPCNRFADMQSPAAVLPREKAAYSLKPESVTYFTTDYIEKAAPVRAENVRVEGDKLVWDAVSDPNHCYYRVFANGEQIASTAAAYIHSPDPDTEYTVLSVDRSGNM